MIINDTITIIIIMVTIMVINITMIITMVRHIDDDFVVLLLLADMGVINPYESLSLPEYGCKESDRSRIPLWWGGWE